MKTWIRSWSLGARMVALFSGLLAAIGVFMIAFFPARMAAQAARSAEQRAAAVAQVMSTALGPALDYDDPDNAAEILRWLATMPDARFGVVRRGAGAVLATWQPEAVPVGQVWTDARRVDLGRDLLIVTMPIRATGGAEGTLHLGFSLSALVSQRTATKEAVGIATAIVLVIGVLATMLLAALLVRPIRRLTQTARRISRGELPPELPAVAGGSEVVEMAEALRAMLERINEVSQQELLRASRQAGMAEVATGVLHNVGNVLTSVNVSVEMMRERTEGLPLDRLRRLGELLGGLAAVGTVTPEQLAALVRYVAVVSEAIERVRDESLGEVKTLRGHVEHIKRVVSMQNAYARLGGFVEPTQLDALVAEAVEIGCSSARRHGIELVVDAAGDTVAIDRHRVLQIVVNLISNARDAVNQAGGDKRIRIEAALVEGRARFTVTDSGVGIATEVRERIFSAGFTTKATGHGYGLHSAALAARQLGGELAVASEGAGRGATFTLTIPVGDQSGARDEQ